MSWEVVGLVYRKKLGSHVRKTVLAYLADKASDDGRGVWVSKGTVAKSLECGRSTVIRTVNDFVDEGILVPVGRRPCTNGETVEYDINLVALEALPDIKEPVHRGTSPAAGPVPERDQSNSGTPPVPERDPYQSRSGTQTSLTTIHEHPSSTGKPPPKFRIPEGWRPSDVGLAHARDMGIPDDLIREEVRGFVIYWTDRRDRDAAKSAQGWEQTWRNRVRDVASRLPRRLAASQQSQPKGRTNGQQEGFRLAIERRRARGMDFGAGDDLA